MLDVRRPVVRACAPCPFPDAARHPPLPSPSAFRYSASMDCANHKLNTSRCTCSYPGCPRHAVCCDCLAYHRGMGELPACCFTPEQERTYDRSVGFFVSVNRR